MTIHEAIVRLDALKHNTFTNAEKLAWLSTLDGRIQGEILDSHRGGPADPFPGYDTTTPGDKKLLVAAPYDEIYIRYLEAQVDFHNGEIEKFNNASALFSAAWQDFARFWNRTHIAKAQNWHYS